MKLNIARLSALGTIGMGDRDELAFLELMLADHAARVAPGGARLRAEARRQRGEAQRQVTLLEKLLHDEIGERYLGGRDKPESGCRAKQILGEFR